MKKSKTYSSFEFLPKEETVEVKISPKKLHIGILKESSFQENRVALTPDSVGLLVANGNNVIIEKGAGQSSSFSDEEYMQQGAVIATSKKEVFSTDFIIKIEPPTKDELSMMSNGQQLISALQTSTQDIDYFNLLKRKNITSFAFEFITDESNKLPFIRVMSEIAGNTSLLIASEYLSNVNNGKGLMLGGITGLIPTNVVIIGAGTVGEYACRASLGLGASVIVFDESITKLRRLQNNINQQVSTSTIQPKILSKAIRRADVIISALRVGSGRVPCVVSEEMVKTMKKGSVVIDVSIDQGGCIETSEVTSHKKPTFIKHDIVHYCVPNIASRVSRTASIAISNLLTPILLKISECGGVNKAIRTHKHLRKGVYSFNGDITNKVLAERFKLMFKDLDLIMATIS